MPNFIKIGQTLAEIWLFNSFSKWRRSAILDWQMRIGTTYEDYSVVCIVVLNLVEIDSAVTDLRMREKNTLLCRFFLLTYLSIYLSVCLSVSSSGLQVTVLGRF